MLVRNKSDKARAEQSVNIGKKYLMALAEQMDENEEQYGNMLMLILFKCFIMIYESTQGVSVQDPRLSSALRRHFEFHKLFFQ